MDRLLRSTAAQITVTVTSAGEPTEAEGAVSVKVYRDSGALLVEGTAVHDSGGIYHYALSPTQTASVDVLKAEWTAKVGGVAGQAFVTYHEIVGGFLASVEAIKDALPKLAEEPSTAEIEAARTLAEDWLEDECRVAFRPRYGHDVLDGGGVRTALLSRPMVIAVKSVNVGGSAVSTFAVSPAGVLRAEEALGEGFQNVDVVYEHGFISVPSEVERAAILLARLFLVPDPSDYDGRSSSVSTDTAHYTLITPGMREAITAIPEVNVVMSFFDFGGVA